MKHPSAPWNLRNGSRSAAAVVMVSLWLALCILQVFPALHGLLHHDAHAPAHECLITQMQHHSVLSAFAPTLVPAPPSTWSQPAKPCAFGFPTLFDYLVSDGRAPPSCFSSAAVVG